MKPFSNRIVGIYMSAFVAVFRQSGRTSYRAASPEFQALAARPDYLPVVKYLEALGLISVTRDNRRQPFRFTLTDAGICYFGKVRDANVEKRWTRGLAIAAIVISLAALLLEFDDRGFFGGPKTTPSPVQSQASALQAPAPAR